MILAAGVTVDARPLLPYAPAGRVATGSLGRCWLRPGPGPAAREGALLPGPGGGGTGYSTLSVLKSHFDLAWSSETLDILP